ncbi:MAG: hypothetical protein WDN04_24160 [Rhodospirillales bacterium]
MLVEIDLNALIRSVLELYAASSVRIDTAWRRICRRCAATKPSCGN